MLLSRLKQWRKESNRSGDWRDILQGVLDPVREKGVGGGRRPFLHLYVSSNKAIFSKHHVYSLNEMYNIETTTKTTFIFLFLWIFKISQFFLGRPSYDGSPSLFPLSPRRFLPICCLAFHLVSLRGLPLDCRHQSCPLSREPFIRSLCNKCGRLWLDHCAEIQMRISNHQQQNTL